jgi:hypothetical protein
MVGWFDGVMVIVKWPSLSFNALSPAGGPLGQVEACRRFTEPSSQSGVFPQSHVGGHFSLTTSVTQSSRHCLPLIDRRHRRGSPRGYQCRLPVPPPPRTFARLPVKVTRPAARAGASRVDLFAVADMVRSFAAEAVARLPVQVTCPGVAGCLKVNSRWCYGQTAARVWTGRRLGGRWHEGAWQRALAQDHRTFGPSSG